MKKLFFFLPAMILCYIIMTGQNTDEPQKWNQPQTTGMYDLSFRTSAQLPIGQDYINPNSVTRYEITPNGVLAITPSIRVLPRNNSSQSEVDIKRHPTNPLIMFGSSNAFNNSGTLFISEGVYVTTNGGVSWYGSDSMLSSPGVPVPNQGGDPGILIDKNGTFIQTHLGFATAGMFGNYSTDNGLTWSSNFTIQSGSVDKNLAGTDDSPTSPFYGRSYVIYVAFASPYPARISYTSNSGVSWTPATTIITPASGYIVRGTDVATGKNGEVYACWANGIGNGAEDFASFAKSIDGGVTFTGANNVFDMNGLLVFGTGFTPYGIRMNSFPRIDVDKSGGPRDGWIYILTSQKNLAPAGSDPDIVMHRSTDGGTTWSAGIRVNQDPLNNGKYQFYNAIRVDESGGINCVYYDNRNTAADSAEVMMSRSLDGGNTWTDVVVSDHRFRPKSITVSGIAAGYAGDYIGVTSGSGKVWPIWMDDITGGFQAWTTGVQISTFPLNSFNLNSPAAGTRIQTLPNNTTNYNFTWDTSASTASYKWIFGSPNATSRQITLQPNGNSLSVTGGQLDNLLAGLGLAQGDSLVGQWDVWAYRNNQTNDSLKATNGPRAITLKRAKPSLIPLVNLISPANNTTILTLVSNTTNININWTKSGEAVKYKWLFARPNFSTNANIKFNVQSNNTGFDSILTLRNSQLDSMLAGIGVTVGDSAVGQWRVYGYSASDSAASVQTYNITLRRGISPTVTTSLDSIAVYLPFGSNTTTRNLVLGNIGQFDLNWNISETSGTLDNLKSTQNNLSQEQINEIVNQPKGATDRYYGQEMTDAQGGPDAGGYRWIDSDEPGGPVFNWVDISTVGTRITTWTNGTGDDGSVVVPIPFTFTYYESPFTQLKICTNGWVGFATASTNAAYSNVAIPVATEPNNCLYPFWDDLDVRTAGGIYYYNDAVNNRFIVEYKDVPHYSTGQLYTFEVMIYTDGRIYYQYLNMTNTLLNSCTIGNENSTGTIGLQVVFNAAYLHNNLAIKIEKGLAWVDETPSAGTILAAGNQNVNVIFNSNGLAIGTYSGKLKVNSNDPVTPVKDVNVRLTVGLSVPSSITLVLEGFYNSVSNKLNIRDTVRIYLRNVSSPYGIVDSAKSVIDSLNFTGSFLFSSAPTGTYYLQVKSRNGLETWSKAGGESYTAGSAFTYNFTSALSQAYGNNMVLISTKNCIYSGDVNHDGIIDISDNGLIDNDVNIFASGYLVTDVNGDGIVDISDQTIADNNAYNFIAKAVPPGAAPAVRKNIEIRKDKTELTSEKNKTELMKQKTK